MNRNRPYEPITLMFSPGPPRDYLMWDTWLYYHQGTYCLFYLGGRCTEWDSHCLAVSSDGVHWKDLGPVLADKPKGYGWVGTGSVWKSPHFEQDGLFITNYSLCLEGTQNQHMRFAQSTDLVNWRLVDDVRFHQDARWYMPDQRWDTINILPDFGNGATGALKGYYGFWTATVDATKSDGHFGFGYSEDGLHWRGLEPLKIEHRTPPEKKPKYEIAGVTKIGKWYYIIYDQGHVVMSESIIGPYRPTPRNSLLTGGMTYFPRLSVNHPSDHLLTFFFCKGRVMLSPLVLVEQAEDGTLFAKWWPQNETLKHEPIPLMLQDPNFRGIALIQPLLDLSRGVIIEAKLKRACHSSEERHSSHDSAPGMHIYSVGDLPDARFFVGNGQTRWEEVSCGGTVLQQTITDRQVDWPEEVRVRLAMKEDCVQVYVEDMLMENRRVAGDGRIGFTEKVSELRAWYADCSCLQPPEVQHADLKALPLREA